jgi:dinuclear metal center YbgI/SA1388 family protein
MKAFEFNGIVSSLAPSRLAYSWDNVGFQIGSKNTEVNRVLCALEVTPPVIEEALERKAQLLLVHHPLIFHPLSAITDDSPVGKMVIEIIKSNLSLIVAHTNLDKSPNGTNRGLAELIALNDLKFFDPEKNNDTVPEYGMGYIGNLVEETNLGNFASSVKKLLDIPYVQMTGDPGKKIRKVAVLTGAGGEYARSMNPGKADVILTGEVNHHAALDAGIAGNAVICAGHFATEVIGMKYFSDILKECDAVKKSGLEILDARMQIAPYSYY